MIAVGQEKQATGDRARHLPELANSALRTIDAPKDVSGRSRNCRTSSQQSWTSFRVELLPSADDDSDLNLLVSHGEILRKWSDTAEPAMPAAVHAPLRFPQ